MSTIASQITSLTIVYSTVYSGTDQRKHQSSASLSFVRGNHRGPHKWPVTRKMFPFDDVIMDIVVSGMETRNSTYKGFMRMLSKSWQHRCSWYLRNNQIERWLCNIRYPNLKPNLVKTRLPTTYFSFTQSFWNLAQSTSVSLPCSVQNLKSIGQVKWMLWTNKISWELSLWWVSGEILYCTAPMVQFSTCHDTRLVLGFRPANERRRYKVTPSLIGWGQT